MTTTKIEWTDAVWNVVTGCTKVSPGCAHCYAEGVAKRLWRGRPFEDVQFHEDRLFQPLHWRKPRRVFVNSMSDLFHENVTDYQIARILDTIVLTPKHTYQVLTKRATRMRDFFTKYRDAEGLTPPKNLWLGVSVENQRMANERIPILLTTPAAVRFVSVEPLLDPVFLRTAWLADIATKLFSPIDWIIVGGESGPKARPCDLANVYRIVQNCGDFNIPCFVKQLGRRPVSSYGIAIKLKDSKGGNPDEWPSALRVREYPR